VCGADPSDEVFPETIPHRPILAKVRRTPDSSWMVQGLFQDGFSTQKEPKQDGKWAISAPDEDGRWSAEALWMRRDPRHEVFSETIPHRPILANRVWRSGRSGQNQTVSVAACLGRP